jgi:hypothetical protein
LVALPFLLLLFPIIGKAVLLLYGVYMIMVWSDCLIHTKSVYVASLSIFSLLVQMAGYGLGFLKALLKR